MKRYRNWIIVFILSATTGAVALQHKLMPATIDVNETAPITRTPAGPCAYMWATQAVPELTEKIETAVLALDADAKIRAEAYGENCVYSDGSATFGAMETDLYIRMNVEDLTNEEAFGNWMAKIMTLIIQIPENEFPGGYGFAEFWFEKTDAEYVIVRAQIPEYFDTEVQAKSGAELFRLFYDKP